MDTPAGSPEGNVVARFEKNSKEEVRVSVDLFHGRQIINIRVFYRDGEQWKHGKQGIALSVERFKDLADAVLQVGQHLKTQGLL
jgi:hypothetical protein